MITMTEIARLTHVSQPTVSRVLNGSQTVDPEIRERVLACAKEHDYQFNALAKGLQGSKTQLLGMLVTDISNGFFADLAKQIETAARKRGYSIILFNSDYNPQNEQEYLGVVRRYRVDGVLAVPIRETSAEWKEYVKKLDVPIVTVTRRAEGLDSVYVDHAQAGAMVAEHLLERDFRRFLFIGKDYDGKYVGFRQLLVQMGYGGQTANLVYQDDVQLKQALEHWLCQASERGAVFAGNDIYALRVLDALRKLDVSIPEEVGVIGFDDTSTGRYLNPRLSSVSQPIAQMAQEAVTRLLDRIEHPGQREVLDYPLSAELVLRERTASSCPFFGTTENTYSFMVCLSAPTGAEIKRKGTCAMDYKKTAQEIYEKVGRKENLVSAAHCATRLRLVLADNARCDAKAVEDIDGVKGVFSASGQLQIILGTGTVNKVYDEFIAISGLTAATKEEVKAAAAAKQNIFKRAIKCLGDIFVPIIPAIVASGFLMGIMEALNFMVNNGFLNIDTSGSIYVFANLFANTAYVFLPILIAYSAAKAFGGNPYLGAVIGMLMIHPDLQNAWTVATQGVLRTQSVWFGLYEVDLVGYQGHVIPVIIAVWVMCFIEKRLHKIVPAMFDLFVTPLVSVFVTGYLTYSIIGPIFVTIENSVIGGIQTLLTLPLGLGSLIMGGLYSTSMTPSTTSSWRPLLSVSPLP